MARIAGPVLGTGPILGTGPVLGDSIRAAVLAVSIWSVWIIELGAIFVILPLAVRGVPLAAAYDAAFRSRPGSAFLVIALGVAGTVALLLVHLALTKRMVERSRTNPSHAWADAAGRAALGAASSVLLSKPVAWIFGMSLYAIDHDRFDQALALTDGLFSPLLYAEWLLLLAAAMVLAIRYVTRMWQFIRQ